MRALRDFNTPKIVTDDVPIFMGLIGDLFPALNVPRKRDLDFEAMVKKSVVVSLILRKFISLIYKVYVSLHLNYNVPCICVYASRNWDYSLRTTLFLRWSNWKNFFMSGIPSLSLATLAQVSWQ